MTPQVLRCRPCPALLSRSPRRSSRVRAEAAGDHLRRAAPSRRCSSPEPPRPVRVVERPTPLPLPGQLKPLPPPEPRRRARAAPIRARASTRPTRGARRAGADGYINAVQVYPFSEGALYQV